MRGQAGPRPPCLINEKDSPAAFPLPDLMSGGLYIQPRGKSTPIPMGAGLIRKPVEDMKRTCQHAASTIFSFLATCCSQTEGRRASRVSSLYVESRHKQARTCRALECQPHVAKGVPLGKQLYFQPGPLKKRLKAALWMASMDLPVAGWEQMEGESMVTPDA
jgi:hypothetical protein